MSDKIRDGQIIEVHRRALCPNEKHLADAIAAICRERTEGEINTYSNEPDSILENWAWEFKDGTVMLVKYCSKEELLIIIEALMKRVRELEVVSK